MATSIKIRLNKINKTNLNKMDKSATAATKNQSFNTKQLLNSQHLCTK
jgi:hypothetical protein